MTFPARRAQPGQVFGYTAAGKQRELRADAAGIVRPETTEDVAVLDGFELPTARPAKTTKHEPGAEPDGGQD